MEPEQLDRDLKRISELFDQEQIAADHDLRRGAVAARTVGASSLYRAQVFPQVHLRLVTNGVLLLRQPEAFWSACRDTGW